MKTDTVERFFEWINERHMIYLRKSAGEPWPWSDDVIFQTYKFTNVFRELDTGTVWYRENWREPFAASPRLFFNTCLYRQFNYWPTAEFLQFQRVWNPIIVENMLRRRKDEGFQIFTGAHMLTGTLGGPERKDKIWQVVWAVLDHLWHNEAKYNPSLNLASTLQEAFSKLKQAPGFGPFLAYEVVTDLRHTRYLCNAPDIMTWANAGPGAMRGLNRIMGWPLKVRKSQVEYNTLMQQLLAISNEYLEEHVPALEMREIEHSLCEFDKYERVRLGQGRPRSRYIPSTK